MKKYGIYGEIARSCPVLQLQGPLQGLQPDIQARTGAADSGPLRSALVERYSREELFEAGVVVSPPDGGHELQLHPDLADPTRAFLPLSSSAHPDPFDLVLDGGGCLSGSAPLLAALSDRTVQAGLAEDGQLLIASSVPDCAALLALGVACTTATGLDHLADPILDAVCRALGWSRTLMFNAQAPIDQAPVGQAPVGQAPIGQAPIGQAPVDQAPIDKVAVNQLVFVGWRPASWSAEPPAALAATCRHLERLRMDLKIQIPQVQLWSPPAASLDSLAFVARHGDVRELQARLCQSMQREVKPLFKSVTKEVTLAKAYRDLGRIDGDQYYADKIQGAFLQQIETRVIEPLFADADACRMKDGGRRLLLAVLSYFYYKKTVPLMFEYARQTPGERSWSSLQGAALDLAPMIKLVRELLRLMPGHKPRRRR